jgi:hypothetical protein
MTAGGHWQKALTALQQHEQLLKTLITEPSIDIHPVRTTRLFTSTYFLPYFRDDLSQNRALQNQVMALCCNNVQTNTRLMYSAISNETVLAKVAPQLDR